jgi:hypothetical protein
VRATRRLPLPAMAAPSPKARHYTTALRAALVSGAFASAAPAHAPNATPLPWAELLRKHGKHCAAPEDGAVAQHTQALALLLGAGHTKGGVDDAAVDGDGVWDGPDELELGAEGTLLKERRSDARAGYDALKAIQEKSKVSVHVCYVRNPQLIRADAVRKARSRVVRVRPGPSRGMRRHLLLRPRSRSGQHDEAQVRHGRQPCGPCIRPRGHPPERSRGRRGWARMEHDRERPLALPPRYSLFSLHHSPT